MSWTEVPPESGSSVTVSTDGTSSVFFTTQDVAGNASAPSAVDTVKIDQTPPVVSSSVSSGTSGSNGWYTSSVQLSATASDATSGLDSAGLAYTIDSGSTQSGSTATVSGDGTHTVVFSAHDVAGNLGSSTQTIKIDTTPPTAGFRIRPERLERLVYLSGHGDTVEHGCHLRDRPAAGFPVGSNWSSSVSISTDGVYTVYSKATDNAGNSSLVVTKTVSLDTTPPVEFPGAAPDPHGLVHQPTGDHRQCK